MATAIHRHKDTKADGKKRLISTKTCAKPGTHKLWRILSKDCVATIPVFPSLTPPS